MTIDLHQLFGFSVHPLEIVLRGTAIYWFLFVLFRFVLRRDVGNIAIADVLLLVLIADASQNAMAGDYKSISEGALLVATIAGWNLGLDAAAYRFKIVRRFVEAKPLPLIKNGEILRRNLRHELITLEELKSKLRAHGVLDPSEVKLAIMESDGEISVIKKDGAPEDVGGPAEGPAVP